MTIHNKLLLSGKITQNKTIIDLVCQFIIEKKEDRDIYNQINHEWLFKKILLPAKLVRARGRK